MDNNKWLHSLHSSIHYGILSCVDSFLSVQWTFWTVQRKAWVWFEAADCDERPCQSLRRWPAGDHHWCHPEVQRGDQLHVSWFASACLPSLLALFCLLLLCVCVYVCVHECVCFVENNFVSVGLCLPSFIASCTYTHTDICTHTCTHA